MTFTKQKNKLAEILQEAHPEHEIHVFNDPNTADFLVFVGKPALVAVEEMTASAEVPEELKHEAVVKRVSEELKLNEQSE